MILNFFKKDSPELSEAKKLITAYMKIADFTSDTVSDDSDGGDWLGMGDAVKVAEIKNFNSKDGTFSFKFVSLGINDSIIINKVDMRVIIHEHEYEFLCCGESVKVIPSESHEYLENVILLAEKHSSVVIK